MGSRGGRQVGFAQRGADIALDGAHDRIERQVVDVEAEGLFQLVAERIQAEERVARRLPSRAA